MEESTDNDNTLRPSELNPSYGTSSEFTPAASGGTRRRRRSDRIVKVLETVLMSFSLGFEDLPSEAQQAYIRFQQNQDFREFGAALRHLLLEERLDELMRESPDFLHAAAELVGNRYPHLNLQERLDDLEDSKRKDSPKRRSNRSDKSRRRAKKEARRGDETMSSNNNTDRPSNARLAKTITTKTRTRQKKGRKGQTVDRTQLEIRAQSGSSEIPTINVVSDETAGNDGGNSAPVNTPVLPGFVISTRTSSRNQEGATSGIEKLRSSQSQKTARSKNPTHLPKPDVNLYPYKGWKVEQPTVLLHQARNFLADEDIDRTLDWSQKFAELTEYFSYLLYNWQGEEWGAELHEVIDMLHTHWIFEQYHYGMPKLNLNFDNAWPKQSKRLPPIPGTNRPVEMSDGADDEDLGERKLLLNKIRPAIDVHYKVPSRALLKCIELYTADAPHTWEVPFESVSSDRGLMNLENEIYEECVFSNMSDTCKRLEAAEADFKSEHDKETFGFEALQAFATLRGTRRAALQQTLSPLNNDENLAVCNVFRTLILPQAKIPEKPDAGIILPTMQVSEVPQKESRDPFGYTIAHRWYMRADQHWGDWAHEHAIKECHGHKLWRNRKEPIMDLPKNFKGPYIHDFLDHEMKKVVSLLKICEVLRDRLLLQKERTPRGFLTDVAKCLDDGLAGKHWVDAGLEFSEEDVVPSSQDLVHIRPEEEDFLRLLGQNSINKKTVNPRIKGVKVGHRSRLFEKRVKDMFYGEGTTNVYRLGFDEFMKELNRDCDGPVKCWRFSEDEAWNEASKLQKKGVIVLHGQTVFRAEANLHPEQLVRWLDTDKDLDAFVQEWDPVSPQEPIENAEASHENDEIETISTVISIPESKNPGDYLFGLPRSEHLRDYEDLAELVSDIGNDTLKQDMRKTKKFYTRLCFRLGRTIRDLRAKQETYRRQLTLDQREDNRDFLDFVVRLWDSDANVRPNKKDKNPKRGDRKWITPEYQDIIKMVEPEAYNTTWDHANREKIRKGIIREAYENKSMIFPSRIDRYTDEDGLTVELPRRHEPVWSFAHPGRKAKAPQYWDMNRWPLHLQRESTAERIRSGNFHADTQENPPFSPTIVTPSVSPVTPTRQQTRREIDEEVDEDTALSTTSAEGTDTYVKETQTIPGLGKDFVVTYGDVAESRRTFTPGPPQYLLGSTPLQKKYVENYIKRGIASAETPTFTWRQRLGALFGRRIVNDPTALPEVNPRDIPQSKPRSKTSDDEDSEEDMPGVMENDDIDVVMEELVTQKPRNDEQEPLETPSPMVPSFPHTSEVPGESTPVAVQGVGRLAGQGSERQNPRSWSRRRSRHLESQRLHLTIEQPDSEASVEYTEEEMP
ncbi:hypothetical protein FVEN_g6282 [Fusarium venenatum]|uniref:Uncharacterized protein n=1 Tax=Fusarium venenatum TaxID=56646 RepID=A0A2L2TUY1_9HYPO|nr:uncharacterized protein FVRRES_01802 [Fusarium venenatum]KAG8355914.1 hypothetical protein FVEN_g6282 [Fusarium venenatum]CEI65290.1 unnamed protein product [Fusarium venenatum]